VRVICAVALATCLACLALGQTASQAEPVKGKVRAFVSILPQAYFVEEVGGGLVQVDVLVGPGQSPHTFEPTPKQMAKLTEAQIYFRIGLPFEDQLVKKIEATNKELKIINTIKGIKHGERDEQKERHPTLESPRAGEPEEHRHHEGEEDPHVWLSPRLAKVIAANICDGLKALDPAHAGEYEKNLRAVHARLDDLDARLARALAPLKGEEFMVFHPAFGHFGKAYGLKQVAVEFEGKEPSARQLAQLIDWAKKREVKVVFVQPQFSAKSAQAVARAIGGAVIPMDPLAKNYIKNLEDMANKVTSALGGQ